MATEITYKLKKTPIMVFLLNSQSFSNYQSNRGRTEVTVKEAKKQFTPAPISMVSDDL